MAVGWLQAGELSLNIAPKMAPASRIVRFDAMKKPQTDHAQPVLMAQHGSRLRRRRPLLEGVPFVQRDLATLVEIGGEI